MKKLKKHHVQNKIRELNEEKFRGIFRCSSRKILPKQEAPCDAPPFRIGPVPEVETPFRPGSFLSSSRRPQVPRDRHGKQKHPPTFKGESSASAACVKKIC